MSAGYALLNALVLAGMIAASVAVTSLMVDAAWQQAECTLSDDCMGARYGRPVLELQP